MKTILVPVDFSEVSKNAALFAYKLASQVNESRIILFNLFDPYLSGSDGSLLQDDTEDRRTIRLMALNNIRRDFATIDGLVIDCVAEEGKSLVHAINHIVTNEMVDLVVMGITGATRIEQMLFGSNTLNVTRHAICPVLVIPPHTAFRNIRKMVLAVDLNDAVESLPKKRVEFMVETFHAELHFIYVEKRNGTPLNSEQEMEKQKLEAWLKPYSPVFHTMGDRNFVKAINEFVSRNEIDLLLTVPRSISYVTDLLHNSHTDRLGYRSQVPFVTIHQ